mmetsp:Transcript_58547/g.139292  ORF Transcript_58547/g.139292 Transcript_58547/m.139292 type:complete len:238 (-) Transcript_58547:137-850(-)
MESDGSAERLAKKESVQHRRVPPRAGVGRGEVRRVAHEHHLPRDHPLAHQLEHRVCLAQVILDNLAPPSDQVPPRLVHEQLLHEREEPGRRLGALHRNPAVGAARGAGDLSLRLRDVHPHLKIHAAPALLARWRAAHGVGCRGHVPVAERAPGLEPGGVHEIAAPAPEHVTRVPGLHVGDVLAEVRPAAVGAEDEVKLLALPVHHQRRFQSAGVEDLADLDAEPHCVWGERGVEVRP